MCEGLLPSVVSSKARISRCR